jgi:type IV pilus assembly protein PilA
VQHGRQTENDQDDGFTLIELLVVMIIIGILAAIAIPTFLHQRQNAVNAGQVSDLRSVAEEIEGFYVNEDQYPSNFSQAGGTVTITTATGTGTQRVTVGNTVTYSLDATGTAFCLTAANPRATQNRVWISDGGGVQPLSTTTCPY